MDAIAEALGIHDRPSDEAQLAAAAERVRSGKYDAITMRCCNEQEVLHLEDWMRRNYPDVKVYFTWQSWPKRGLSLRGQQKN